MGSIRKTAILQSVWSLRKIHPVLPLRAGVSAYSGQIKGIVLKRYTNPIFKHGQLCEKNLIMNESQGCSSLFWLYMQNIVCNCIYNF